MIKIVETIDVNSLLESYNLIEPNIQWTDYYLKGKQAGLQYKVNDDPWNSAVGKQNGRDHEYNIINPLFKGTIFETLIDKYHLTRSRLMWVYGMACYSMHIDETPRIQIPIITNPDCYFIFKNLPPIHLRAGNVYFVDTRQYHTFANCSDHARLHFVGCSTGK